MKRHGMKTPESRMLGNLHVRFGGGLTEKQVKLLAGGLPYHVAHSPGELHLALTRMWAALWANVEDEIARARGHGANGTFLGLSQIPVEDLTAAPAAARASGRANGSRPG